MVKITILEWEPIDFNNPFDWDMADNKFKNVTAEFLNAKEQEALLDKTIISRK